MSESTMNVQITVTVPASEVGLFRLQQIQSYITSVTGQSAHLIISGMQGLVAVQDSKSNLEREIPVKSPEAPPESQLLFGDQINRFLGLSPKTNAAQLLNRWGIQRFKSGRMYGVRVADLKTLRPKLRGNRFKEGKPSELVSGSLFREEDPAAPGDNHFS